VRTDEPVVELETEKATTEIAAPAAGQLAIQVPEGQTVAIGAVVGQINTDADGAAKKPAEASQAKEKPPVAPPAASAAQSPERPLSPAVRRLAAEEHVDVRQVPGTGRGCRVTKDDILAHLDKRQDGAQQAPARE